MKNILLLLLGFVAGAVLVQKHDKARCEVVTDTIIDTVVIKEPVPVREEVVKYVAVKLPVKKDTFLTAQKDTIFMRDSVLVEVPIERKEYKDSLFRAVVSGYLPKLEEVEVYPRTIIQKEVQKRNRLGFGLQGGVGITPKGVQPYIGVGAFYRF